MLTQKHSYLAPHFNYLRPISLVKRLVQEAVLKFSIDGTWIMDSDNYYAH